tara:strand:- start:3159 stop:6620 length:3462 start_codon:yes stop_codon:yes gene_type:complete
MRLKELLRIIVWGLFLMISIQACSGSDDSITNESETYEQAVSDFYMSLGASQTDQTRFAFNKMNDVATAYPEEPAAWANLGVYAMRQGNYDLAKDRIERAIELQPNNADLLYLGGLIISRQGDLSAAIELLRRAVSNDPQHIRANYALVQEIEREDDTANADEIIEILENLIQLIPENQVVQLELIRVGVKERDLNLIEKYLIQIEESVNETDPEIRDQLEEVKSLYEEQNFIDLSLELSFLRSGLESTPEFQQDLLLVQLPPTDVGFLIPQFLHLPIPKVSVSSADLMMRFEKQPIDLPVENAIWVKGATLLEDSPPFPVSVYEGQLIIDEQTRLSFPGTTNEILPVNSITEIDYNYTFRNDLAMAGSEGFKLFRLNDDQTFSDVTNEIGLSGDILNRPYKSVWPLDIEMDGDLDLILAVEEGRPILLRNNGDGTFTDQNPFHYLENISEFQWADLDGDGVPEATFLTADGEVFILTNDRGGRFSEPENVLSGIAAITVSDIDADGWFEVIAVSESGTFSTIKYSQRLGEMVVENFINDWNRALNQKSTNLFSADLDNNGALDLILSTQEQTFLWLGSENREPLLYEQTIPGGIVNIFDVSGNERLDLLGIDQDLVPFQLRNEGTKNYFARSIRARASGDTGDQRINSFGIGGEMEVRTGLLYQKQLISSPIVHFGLGEHEEADMLRIIWPNGSVQAEFAELGMGATIFNEQILKGSCPWLFSNDGEEIHFITDALWRSPLGLRINSQETAGVIQTFDRVRIPGNKLQIVDDIYDLRITAELWETHFFDYVNLVAIDHPVGTDVYVDERFVFPAPDLSTQIMTTPGSVRKVVDENGNDLTEIVSEIDQNYSKPFEKTAYQGLVKDHSIIVELDDREGQNGDWLILSGWMRPTDSSINLALSQGTIQPPKGLKVEINNREGDWVTLHEDYGFPAGKLKSILLNLEDQFSENADKKVRISTTTEIYWDGIFQADKVETSRMIEHSLKPVRKELRYRGFSEWNRADERSPKLPTYSEISSTNQRWRDLEGFHTRFGDVSPLLTEIDDRYVIMNAGDELVLHFQSLPDPAEGYIRTYVFESDGWVKDGDYNTEASATVLPLPYHGQADYEYSEQGSLFSDPVFQRHRMDWVNYHTRYVTPHDFRTALNFEKFDFND